MAGSRGGKCAEPSDAYWHGSTGRSGRGSPSPAMINGAASRIPTTAPAPLLPMNARRRERSRQPNRHPNQQIASSVSM